MRKFIDMVEERLRKNPERIDGFIETQFEEYAKDGDLGALLAALQIASRAKGVAIAAESGEGADNPLQKALIEDDSPKLESTNAMLHALGYRLSVQPLEAARSATS